MTGRTPEQRLWAMADLATPMAIRVAATLRVADHLADGARTAAELAQAIGTDVDPDGLERVLRHLAVVGLLERDRDGRYTLTDLGRPLRSDHGSGLRAILDVEGALGRGDLAFVHLLHSVRTGEAAFPLLFGSAFWDDLAGDADRSAGYDAQMGADVAAWAPHVVAAHDWSRLGHVVDVGGGNGTLLAAILAVHPHLRGTLLDQPSTAEAAREMFATAGVSDRAEAVGGSFFEAIPTGGDAYILCAVLHDWDDRAALAILERTAAAAGPSGTVIVVEKTGAEGEPPPSHMDLRVLVYFGGRERSAEDLIDLAGRAGLAITDVHRSGDLSVLAFSPT